MQHESETNKSPNNGNIFKLIIAKKSGLYKLLIGSVIKLLVGQTTRSLNNAPLNISIVLKQKISHNYSAFERISGLKPTF